MVNIVSRILLVVLMAATGGSFFSDDASAATDNKGFIYGHVTTESGNDYVGFLRWGNEETFWDDLFHSAKTENPYTEYVDEDQRPEDERSESRIRIFNYSVKFGSKNWPVDHVFIARFGDIDRIEPQGGEGALVIMRNGEQYEVEGYANDVGGKIQVDDKDMGRIVLRWDRIETIDFMAAPSGADPGAWRLHGKVESDAGDFEGFIQWDKQECLNIDKLDGDTEDGDVSLDMGNIRTIERRGSSRSIVTLKDGREMRLRGSNDVNDENRGIMVEDQRFGRVTVSWDAFDQITFSDAGKSGKGYDEYRPLGRLSGTVTTSEGAELRGEIVFDMDEAEAWEMLNGSYRDVEFDIPFANIRSITPEGHDEAEIVLRSGETLILEDSQDVTDRNDGVLVFTRGGDEPEYVTWESIANITFD